MTSNKELEYTYRLLKELYKIYKERPEKFEAYIINAIKAIEPDELPSE